MKGGVERIILAAFIDVHNFKGKNCPLAGLLVS